MSTGKQSKLNDSYKEILKLIIKSVEINGREMVAVHLYEPFKKMYEESLEKCNILKKQEVTIKTEIQRKVCILESSDGRWTPYRRTMVSLAEALVGVD